MERQGRAKMAELEPRWPKRAPRWSQDGQVGAKMEPTWLQDAKDASTWVDIVPILRKNNRVFQSVLLVLETLTEPQVAQELEPRWF